MMRASLFAAALAAALPAAAQDLTVVNAKAWTGTEAGVVETATISIRDGVIAGVQAGLSAPRGGVEVIDAGGRWVTPGVFAPFSRVGLSEVNAEDSANDAVAATSPYSAALRAADGFNPDATSVAVTRIEGVTRLALAPVPAGTSVFAGQGLIADTSGGADGVLDAQAFTFVILGETGAAAAGGSRASAMAQFRAGLTDARSFPSRFIAHNEGDAVSRVDARELGPAARGEQLILVQAHRASDLRAVIALKEEMPALRLAVVGADEGWRVAEALAQAEIPVIVDPFQNLPASFEQLGATQRNAERLIEAGVTTAFAHLGDNAHQTRLVLQSAGNAVANGVDRDAALEAITGAPAAIFGQAAVGDLAQGQAGDLVIWDGDPLEVSSSPDAVVIGGVATSLESRQTRLRDRYLDLETDAPFAFRR